MRKNMGSTDRLLRTFLVAPLAVVAAVLFGVGSIFGIVLLVAAGVMVATAAVGFCPLYAVIGIETCPVRSAKAT